MAKPVRGPGVKRAARAREPGRSRRRQPVRRATSARFATRSPACRRPWPRRCCCSRRTPTAFAGCGRSSYAPTAPTWGHNNRTVALRVPTGAPGARRIEHRVAGADANPYLVLAAVLAGIHHGLTHELEPDAPITGNAYAQVAPTLPLSWDRGDRGVGRRDHPARLPRRTVLPAVSGMSGGRARSLRRPHHARRSTHGI